MDLIAYDALRRVLLVGADRNQAVLEDVDLLTDRVYDVVVVGRTVVLTVELNDGDPTKDRQPVSTLTESYDS